MPIELNQSSYETKSSIATKSVYLGFDDGVGTGSIKVAPAAEGEEPKAVKFSGTHMGNGRVCRDFVLDEDV